MQRSTNLFSVLALLLLTTSATLMVHAGDCAHCGCNCSCQKVCHLVREEKKVVVTCWGCKCEDFCIPGPSCPGCKHCETVCEFCDEGDASKGIYVQPKKFVWTEWIPGCAELHTKRKLMKRTITRKIPSYKWVVEDLCEDCKKSLPTTAVEPGASVPPSPILRTKLERPATLKSSR